MRNHVKSNPEFTERYAKPPRRSKAEKKKPQVSMVNQEQDQSSTRAKKNPQLYLLLQAMPQNTPLKSRSGHTTVENPSDGSTSLHDDVQHSDNNNIK